jgi:hypothetical protein
MAAVLLRNPSSRMLSGALALGLSLTLAACSSGSPKAKSTTTTTRPKVLAVKTSVLKVGSVDVQSAGPPNVQIDPATGKAVLDVAQAYIDGAFFGPLKTGQIGAGYGAVFDAGVKVAATTADQSALTDLTVGKVSSLSSSATRVGLSAFAGSLGQVVYVATDFGLTLYATVAGGPMTITHNVELTFAQTGKSWLVAAYRVQTVRRSATGTTTTTATGGTTP